VNTKLRDVSLSGLTAPARRAGWFATAAAPAAFNTNAWNLFDALMRWAKAGLPAACTTNSDCPGSTCVAGSCSTSCATNSECPAGKICQMGSCI
jgi:hypothetical protein